MKVQSFPRSALLGDGAAFIRRRGKSALIPFATALTTTCADDPIY
jgi:hypothetical protein